MMMTVEKKVSANFPAPSARSDRLNKLLIRHVVCMQSDVERWLRTEIENASVVVKNAAWTRHHELLMVRNDDSSYASLAFKFPSDWESLI